MLAGEFGAHVTGVDVEPQLAERARMHAQEADLTNLIEIRLVEPGPLPFPDAAFDVVFSKDALIHIPDKAALYGEVLRVLRPDGAFAASDWLSGPGAMEDPDFQHYLDVGHLSFAMATARETEAVMRVAGFEGVRSLDRNAWYAEISAEEVRQIEGPLRDQVIGVSSTEIYETWRVVRRALAAATQSGALRPTHLHGRKPAT